MIIENAIPEPNSGCWIWLGAVTAKGYGSFQIPRKEVGRKTWTSAHRRAYVEEHGPIPQGLQVRHKCGNRLCVNPDHLELGTQAENEQDKKRHGTFNTGIYDRGDFCRRGHFTRGEGADVYVDKQGSRHCNQCRRDRNRRNRAAER